jgi:hypothetical protein
MNKKQLNEYPAQIHEEEKIKKILRCRVNASLKFLGGHNYYTSTNLRNLEDCLSIVNIFPFENGNESF